MAEPVSIITFAIAAAIRDQPELAAAEVLKLIQENARLDMENAMLKARLAQLVGADLIYGYS